MANAASVKILSFNRQCNTASKHSSNGWPSNSTSSATRFSAVNHATARSSTSIRVDVIFIHSHICVKRVDKTQPQQSRYDICSKKKLRLLTSAVLDIRVLLCFLGRRLYSKWGLSVKKYCSMWCWFCSLLWPPYGIWQAIIFVLWFLLFFLAYSQPSQGRLDVYHTSTHGVALVQIQDTRLKRAAWGSLKIQDAKNCHLHTISFILWTCSMQSIGHDTIKCCWLC